MYSRILVAVDGSPAGNAALRHAIDLAKASGAALRIAHVVDTGLTPLAAELALDLHARSDARRHAGRAVLDAAASVVTASGLQAESDLLETGAPTEKPADAIVELASAWPADLILTGTHGRTGVARLFLGSVTNDVARRSKIPVLIVPAP